MTMATKVLLEALIRHGKGMLSECEKWVHAQPSNHDLCHNSTSNSHRSAASPAHPATDAPANLVLTRRQ